MRFDVVVSHSRYAAQCVLRRVTAQIRRGSRYCSRNQYHQCSASENVVRREIRGDDQCQREQRSENRRVIDEQVEMGASEHGQTVELAATIAK